MKSRKNKTFKAYEKLLRKDNDWDYRYLLDLEKKKLSRMYDFFSDSKNCHGSGKETVARDLRICLRLIDIIREEDPVSKEFLNRVTSGITWTSVKLDNGNYQLKRVEEDKRNRQYPTHVNHRNEKRFINSIPLTMSLLTNALAPDDNLKRHIEHLKENLRIKKAIHLYNRIRALRMETWWD